MIHSNIICDHCGTSFTYESNRKQPKRFCKSACRTAAHYRENKEPYLARAKAQQDAPEYLEKQRAYYHANKERIAESSRAWREKNAERIKANKAAYYRENREARLAYWHAWASDPENRMSTRENTRAWMKNNPDRARSNAAASRARRRSAVVEVFDPHEVFERDGWICQLCGDPVDPEIKWPNVLSKSLDHIIPVSRGGEHSRANAQLAHAGCNASKNDRLPDEITGQYKPIPN